MKRIAAWLRGWMIVTAAVTALIATPLALGAYTSNTTGTTLNGVLEALSDLVTAVTGPIPAGTNVIGKVGIDQTTPGTTNLVQEPDAYQFSGSCSASCTSAPQNVLWSQSTKGYRGISVTLTTFASGTTVVVEQSPDSTDGSNGSWYATNGYSCIFPMTGATLNFSGASSCYTLEMAWVRARTTAYGGSGTIVAAGVMKTSAIYFSGHAQIGILPTTNSSMGVSLVQSSAAEGSRVIKNAANNLYWGQITTGANAGYWMIFNATSAPADGAVTPVICRKVAANTTDTVSWNPGPAVIFNTGITFVFSTTGCFTKTIDNTAFFAGMAGS